MGIRRHELGAGEVTIDSLIDRLEPLARSKLGADPTWKIAHVQITDSRDWIVKGSVTNGVKTRGRLKGTPRWTRPYQTTVLTREEILSVVGAP